MAVKKKPVYKRKPTRTNYGMRTRQLSEVTLPHRTGRNISDRIIKDVHEGLKDAGPQTCLEFEGIGAWMYNKVKKALEKDFNIDFNEGQSLLYVWRGRDRNGG